jgi:hypothetical protein
MGEGKKKLPAKLAQFKTSGEQQASPGESLTQDVSQVLEAKDMDQPAALSDFDQEVMIAARRFMSRHPDLLTRLAK